MSSRFPKCAICGKVITSAPSKEHIFPLAILKWAVASGSGMDYQKIDDLLHSPANTTYTHVHCNRKKADRIVNYKNLHLVSENRKALTKLADSLAPYTEAFIDFKRRILVRQDYHCFCCGKPLKLANAIIRRIDPTKDRVEQNACCVCISCNDSQKHFRTTLR